MLACQGIKARDALVSRAALECGRPDWDTLHRDGRSGVSCPTMDTDKHGIPSLPLDRAVLTRAVCALLGRESVTIERYEVRPLSGSSGAATAGIYRVWGTANHRDIQRDWALILKIIRPAAAAWNPAAREIDHPIYWKRE